MSDFKKSATLLYRVGEGPTPNTVVCREETMTLVSGTPGINVVLKREEGREFVFTEEEFNRKSMEYMNNTPLFRSLNKARTK